MTGAEISKTAIAIAGIVAGAWAIKSIAVPLIKEKFKSKRNEIEAKIKTSNDELKKQYLTTVQTITQTAIDGMRCVAQGLSIADPTTIAIDGQPVPIDVFNKEIEKAGLIKHEGVIVDATFVEAPNT